MLATLSRYYQFESYQEFAAFDQKLTRQLAAGQVLTSAPVTGPALQQANAYYHLLGTAQLWVLSEPDNAWRGYFLPLEEALIYEGQLRGQDRRARLGCLLAAGLAGGLVTWVLAN